MKVKPDIRLFTSQAVAMSFESEAQELEQTLFADLIVKLEDATPSNVVIADTDIDTDEDTITIESHGLKTGLKLTEVTTADTLPTGISGSTEYYVIVVDDDTIQLATSQENAEAGTAVDISAAGTGPHQLVVAQTIAGTVKVERDNEMANSEDDTWWAEVANSSTNFSAAGNVAIPLPNIGYNRMRVAITVTSGMVSASAKLTRKGA